MSAIQRVCWLQHAEHEELGCIAPWLKQRGYAVKRVRLYTGELAPGLTEFDWLIAMGGPMNIYQHERYPWLVQEKTIIHDACVNNKKVLGICLGAQLIAEVLGGKVFANPNVEIGFYQVRKTAIVDNSQHFTDFPMAFSAFHWHGDTFSMPAGCQNLIESDACVNQAFSWGDRVVGIQFHLEVTLADARVWLEQEDLKPERYVQSAEEILRDPERFALNNALMIRLLERLGGIK